MEKEEGEEKSYAEDWDKADLESLYLCQYLEPNMVLVGFKLLDSGSSALCNHYKPGTQQTCDLLSGGTTLILPPIRIKVAVAG